MFESKINRGRANGYAPLNGDGKVGLNYLPDVVGVAGTSGTSGVNGVNGSQGSSGANGTNGLNGTNGTSGTSPFAEVDTGSFATTGSNTFTGVQTLAGTSGTSWAELIIGQTDIFGNYNSYDIRATGSSAAGISLTSDVVSVVGVVDKEFGPDGNNSVVFSGKYGFPYSDGTFTGIGVQQSGSQQKVWIYDYKGISAFPGDVNIGYTGFVAGEYSGSLNVNNGNINVSGSINTTGSLNISTGSVNIKNGNINVSGSVYVSSSLVVSSTFVNNATIDALNSDLIIDGGDIILSGSMYFGSGSSISETSSSIIITPAGAAAGQSLVVRQTGIANLYSDHPSGFYSGDTITLTYSPNNTSVASGSAPYIFTGCTQEQLGTSLSGSLIYNNETTKTLTWTIPALSDISGFTFEIYNFVFFISQSISLSSSGSSEQSHIHLVSGDPSLVDIYLGDDDQYVKIEKNGGDVVIGTNLNTHHWRFDTSGSLIVPGNINGAGNLATTGSNTFIGNQIITGSVNIKKPIISIGQDLEGGKVAYILQSGDIGYDETLIQGIIAAESDEIQLLSFTLANEACDIKTTNGYSDWYLPSLMELDILYTNRVAIGGFVNDYYWSSSESQALVGWMNNFTNGAHEEFAESYQAHVRAIRIFSIPNEKALNVDGDTLIDGNIILSGSLIQQVNYAPFGSGSYSGATTLDITKDIHLLDVTGIETDNHWILPDGLYDGQVVRFALKGDGTANPNGIYIWPNHLRSGLGSLRNGQSWSPFYDNSAGSARSLATAVYVDGAWNIDNGFYNLD